MVHVNECSVRDYTAAKRISTSEVGSCDCNGSDYKGSSEGPTANVKVSYLNNIIIVTMTESEDKHIPTLILTLSQQSE